MRSVLISIKPEWVAKILNGEKTIEIRKKFPKDYVGWIYLYITKGKPTLYFNNKKSFVDIGEQLPTINGKVVARFWCDKVDSFDWYQVDEELCALSCLTEKQLEDYVGSGIAYAIHINDLEIFDKPKEISEFKHLTCRNCKTQFIRPLTRAPESYCYVEV